MKSSKIFVLLLFCFMPLFAEYKIVGYLPQYRNLDLKKVKLLTDLIIFSVQPEKDGSLKVEDSLLKLLQKAKAVKNCRKFICVGGWGKSENFKEVSLNKELRKTFITNLVNFVKLHQLDGIDYDWEHPKNKDEARAYEQLIKETAAHGIKVSLAASSWQSFTPEVFKHLFALNIMSYDHPKEHSTLELAKEDVKKFIKMGCPPEKINLGVPFYGRHIENRKAMSYNKMFLKD
ncbi:MAG: glycoside hydrolase family 18 protein, partial [Lentisphaeraceae bacterium]|nr:glycoside hydrolase family 18 protein [Lentisphaeraceae bacterium]